MSSSPRTIFCIDLDAFFVSVERLLRPDLVGRPVIVGGGGSRGVVAAASYEARKYGVRSAMPMVEAERRLRGVPGVAVVPPRHGVYGEWSARVRATLEREVPVLEQASIDEFYGDVTGHPARLPPVALAEGIARRVREEHGLPVSIGAGSSKLVAKIATDEAKPAGVLYVLPGREASFLAELPVDRIPGVGPKTAPRLRAIGVVRIADVERAGAVAIEAVLGPAGAAWLLDAARGRDAAPVEEREEARSIGHEETFERDLATLDEIDAVAADLADRVAYRLRQEGLAARTVQVKLRYARRRRAYVPGTATRDVYETVTRAATGPATQDEREIAARARALIAKHWRAGEPVRLVGVSASHLGPPESQGTLFDAAERARGARLTSALDGIRGRFGFDAIAWGAALRKDPGAGV